LGFRVSAGLSWVSIGEKRKQTIFFGNMEEAFDRVPRVVEQVLQAALLHKNSLCFLARVAPGVHGAGELDSMGSAKVILDKNSTSSHEKRRMESS